MPGPGGVDNRSADSAYTTKDNIVVPASSSPTAAHDTAILDRAANIERLHNPGMPTAMAGSGSAANETRATKGKA